MDLVIKSSQSHLTLLPIDTYPLYIPYTLMPYYLPLYIIFFCCFFFVFLSNVELICS